MSKKTNNTIRANSTQEHLDRLDIAVRLNNVTVEFNGRPTLLNINLDIQAGSLMAILGPNNAGKTTLLKTIIGLNKPVAGSVYIFARPTQTLKNDIAYVPERNSVNWQFPITLYDLVCMGAYNKLKFYQRFSNKEKELVHDALGRLSLSHIANKSICDLTRGEKHRALIARALVQNARIMIMDEPMVSADDESIDIIIKLIKELHKEQKTIIVAHHDTITIPKYFQTVAFINTKIIAVGKTSEIFTKENFNITYGVKSDILSNNIS